MSKTKTRERTASRAGCYLIPIRDITGNTNPRYPLSDAVKKLGYGIFTATEKLPSIFELAASDDPEKRQQYVNLIKEHDPEFYAWSMTFLSAGQLQPAAVREGGSGKYVLAFGCRRALALLLLWCVLGKPAEPVIEAKLLKDNETDMLLKAELENTRKQPNPIEEAKSLRCALNTGQDLAEAAAARGISESTAKNRLALLQLPVKKQAAIEAGTLKPTKALKAAKASTNGDGHESNGDGESNGKPSPRRRSPKEIRAAMAEFTETHIAYKVLAWALGEAETFTV